jgi:hypothetical protein
MNGGGRPFAAENNQRRTGHGRRQILPAVVRGVLLLIVIFFLLSWPAPKWDNFGADEDYWLQSLQMPYPLIE